MQEHAHLEESFKDVNVCKLTDNLVRLPIDASAQVFDLHENIFNTSTRWFQLWSARSTTANRVFHCSAHFLRFFSLPCSSSSYQTVIICSHLFISLDPSFFLYCRVTSSQSWILVLWSELLKLNSFTLIFGSWVDLPIAFVTSSFPMCVVFRSTLLELVKNYVR